MSHSFKIPQINTSSSKSEAKRTESTYKREPFVSPFFGKQAKDDLSATVASYGNSGAQYDIFRNQEEKVRKDDTSDYAPYVDDRKVSSRSDLTEEEIKRPSYLNLDPAYADIYGSTQPESTYQAPIRNEAIIEDEPSYEEPVNPAYVEPAPSNDIYEEESFDTSPSYEEAVKEEAEEVVIPTPVKKPEPPKSSYTPKKRSRYVTPPLSLLVRGNGNVSGDGFIETQRNAIDQTLKDFGIAAKVVSYVKGPSVTLYEVAVEPGTRIELINNIRANIQAKALAKTIRVQAPIPGKATAGIELPNVEKDAVHFGDLVANQAFLKDGKPLNTVIGLDIAGKPLYFDIKKGPHALVAGTTGSGKSVCINCIINSIIFKDHPDDVKLILVDPKMVEFLPYANLPHLAMPVLTEPKQSVAALKWLCEEMDNRFRMMIPFHVREIDEYNAVASQRSDVPKLPYLVCIIDELADLVSTGGNDVLAYIQRLTQKGRASGIHLIMATQRPTTDIISGAIKTNASVRIAFQVRSAIDSNVILDHKGAETLLGHGDLLFNNSVDELRAQGAFISNEEITAVTSFLDENGNPDFICDLSEEVERIEHQESCAIDDDEFKEIARYVVVNNNASINRIQKEFNCGFNKAQQIMETLEELGIVSENLGSRARVVKVTYSELEEILGRI